MKIGRILNPALLLLLAFVFSLSTISGCGGNQAMSGKARRFNTGSQPTASAETEQKTDSTDQEKQSGKSSASVKATAHQDEAIATDPAKARPDEQEYSGRMDSHSPSKSIHREQFYSTTDIIDSASAVDDDIWRQFDLADEYHAMGVIANREGSWEEAQEYFEKAIRILAVLDIESDSLETPESAKYSIILDNILSDYRVTLRSLGRLQEDVSAAVLIERYADLDKNLDNNAIKVYDDEKTQVVYDLPIVMNDRVKKSIVYFQTVAREAFKKYLSRSTRYEKMMKEIIGEYGLPHDLVYLSLVESGYNPRAYSWARASGLWQFIASTGRLYGLKRNWWIDERRDPVKATHAACRFLKDLYEQFGSWELAMAAYNGGPGRVRRTIKKQKTRDFWKMRLKRQTMDYVPLIMAATIMAKEPEKYGFTDIEFEEPIAHDQVEIKKCLELKVIAKEIGCTLKELQDINPELLRRYTPPNVKSYMLNIPLGTKDKFLAAYDDMPSPKETSWVKHKIRRGETVSTIAARYGVSQYAIFESNNLSRRSRIYAGKTIIVPVPLDGAPSRKSHRKNKDYKARKSIYAVRSGDTMWDIARAFGTTVDALRRINYIERGSRIYVGQKLKIPSDAKKLKDKNSSGSSGKVYASIGQSKSSSKSSNKKKGSTYKVRHGDTLWDIARKYGTTITKIRQLNSLGRSSRIYPGQVLKVVGNLPEYVIHRVKRGETLGRIAAKYRTSISNITATNDVPNPNRLRVGQKLRIKTR